VEDVGTVERPKAAIQLTEALDFGIRLGSREPPSDLSDRDAAFPPALDRLFAARESAGEFLEAHVEDSSGPVGGFDRRGLPGPRAGAAQRLVAGRSR
jgi:hypothetical protein